MPITVVIIQTLKQEILSISIRTEKQENGYLADYTICILSGLSTARFYGLLRYGAYVLAEPLFRFRESG